MVDERPEDTPPPDLGRAKRAPQTIDLEASEVSSETQKPDVDADAPPERPTPSPSRTAVTAGIIAAISGAGRPYGPARRWTTER